VIRPIAIALSMSIFAYSATASVDVSEEDFSQEERDMLIDSVIPTGLSDIWSDPTIQSCWKSAVNGNDSSLASLFLIMDSRTVIDEMAKRREQNVAAASISKEAYEKSRSSFTIDDLNKVREATQVLPIALDYCNNLEQNTNK